MRLLLLLGVIAIGFAKDLDCSFKATYPQQYVASQVPEDHIDIDGEVSEEEWIGAEWSQNFVDIADSEKLPRYATQVKLAWDRRFLYVAGKIHEPNIWANISSTCHCNTTKEDQIIYHDNDFEVFIDPSGSTQMYKEFEVNAANATWDLMLNKPYSNGGYENSSRIQGPEGFDLLKFGLKSATKVYGAFNSPKQSSPSDYWTVEIALPIDGLLTNLNSDVYFPKQGVFWRINFSRVEWKVRVRENKYEKLPLPEDNWVWSPQGEVNMHLPERWGVLQFAEAEQPTTPVQDPTWTVRQIAFALYYAQMRFKLEFGKFSSTLENLKRFIEPSIEKSVLGGCSLLPEVLNANENSFVLRVTSFDKVSVATINESRDFRILRNMNAFVAES